MSLLLASPFVGAAAQRTFVASYGVPANTAFNCSITKPCRAFSDAIGVTSAGGEVIVLDSAGYGAVTITQSVSLIAPAGIYAGISVFSGDGITVSAPGATVVLRGLSINGQGGSSGVLLQQAARLRIESCVISNMAANGILAVAAGEMSVLDTIVRDNGGTGIGIASNAFVVLDHVRSEHNQFDGFYISSVGGEARAVITDSIFAFNGVNGASVTTSGVDATFAQVERSVLADNGAAGFAVSSAANSNVAVALTRNAIHRNVGAGIAVAGPGYTAATLSENAILHHGGVGLSASGANTLVHASANSLASITSTPSFDFVQSNGAVVHVYGNNVGLWGAQGAFLLSTGF